MAAGYPTPGAPVPDFTLAAMVSRRKVSPGAGRALILIFHAPNAAFAVDRLNREVRERYPSPKELTVASVMDPSLVPPFFRPSARMALDASYRRAAAWPPPDADPAGYVVYPWPTRRAAPRPTTARAAPTSSRSWSSGVTANSSTAARARTSPRGRWSSWNGPDPRERAAR